MKKFLTTLLTAAAVAVGLFALTPSAHAQPVPSFAAQTVAVPLTLAAATTTNFVNPLYIDASKSQHVAFSCYTSWSTAGEATGNTNILYTLAPTLDGVIYDTNRTVTVASYNRSTTAGAFSPSSTNLDANGFRGWYLIKAANNSAAGVATNSATSGFVYSIKIGAP
jgi:hypothetical protein